LTFNQTLIELMTLKHYQFVLVGCLCLLGGAQAEEQSVIDKTMSAVGRAADATVRGIERGARAAGHGIEVGLNAAAHGIKRGADATSDALHKAGNKISGSADSESPAGGSAESGNEKKPMPPPSQSKAFMAAYC
jgi:hypothetical protein